MSNINERLQVNNTKIEELKAMVQNLPEAAEPIYGISSLQYYKTISNVNNYSVTSYCKGYFSTVDNRTSANYYEFYKINSDNTYTLVSRINNGSTVVQNLAIIDIIDNYLYYILVNSGSGQIKDFPVKRLNLTSLKDEAYFTATTSSAYYASGWHSVLYDGYYFDFYNGIYRIDLENKTLIKEHAHPSYTGLVNIHPNFYLTQSSGQDWLYKKSTGATYTNSTNELIKFINATGTKVIKGNNLYTLNQDMTIGSLLKSNIVSDNYCYSYIGGNIYLYRDGVYEFDEDTNTFIKTESLSNVSFNTNVPTFISSSYINMITKVLDLQSIIGYTINGKNMYIESTSYSNTGNILEGKTYYEKNNVAITGTMPDNGALNYTPSTSEQTIPTGYTSGGTIAAVTAAIDSNIVAENIREGIEILGVEGTVQEGAQGVVLYSSTAEMEEDTSQDEGTYGVVAGTNFEGVYKYTDSAWVIVGDPVEALVAFNELAEVLGDSSEEYEGLGGTEEEITEILEDVIGEEGGNE